MSRGYYYLRSILCLLGTDHYFLFDGGRGGRAGGLENFHMQTFLLFSVPAANNFFRDPVSRKHFFLLAYNLFQKIFQPPPPAPTLVLPGEERCVTTLKTAV